MGDFFAFRYGGAILKGPSADGTAGQFLQTDGSGKTSFATVNTDITGTTAGSPSPAVDGDSDTGLFSPAPDVLALTAGGVEGLRVTETTGEVTLKKSRDDTSNDYSDILIENESVGDAVLTLKNSSVQYNIGINASASNNLNITYSDSGDLMGNRIMAMSSNGVAFNTAFADFPLQVAGDGTSLALALTSNENGGSGDGVGFWSYDNANNDVDLIIGREYTTDSNAIEWARFDMDGRLTWHVDSTAIASGKMENDSISLYLDGSGNLIAKKKDGSGTLTTARLNNAAFA